MVHSFWKISGRDILKGSTVFPYGLFQTINNHCFSNWKQSLDQVIFFRVLPRGCLHCRLFKQMEQKFSRVPVKAEKRDNGSFPFDQNFRSEFLTISCSDWNSIFKKRGQPRDVYPNFGKNFPECFRYWNLVRFVISQVLGSHYLEQDF